VAGLENQAPGALFRVEVRRRETHDLLVLAGQIGLDAAVQLRGEALLLASGERAVDVDWREAETVTAGALQVLLALRIALSERGQGLRVVEDHPNIRRLLEAAGLSAYFPVPETLP
jgi:anti-anti-sigma regulatory factor